MIMNEDKIIQKLIEHDEAFSYIKENMVTRSEFLTAHEEVVIFLKKLDQERIFTLSPFGRAATTNAAQAN